MGRNYFSDVIDYSFEIVGADGKMYPLISNPQLSVTWENKDRFIETFTKFRLTEFQTQCEAIKRGLESVVPVEVLSLLTWQELELLVCGRTALDLELLKANTTYSGHSASDSHIQLFWQMMSDRLTPDEQAKFLRFVWGRSRLPLRSSDFERPFKISSHSPSDSAGGARGQTYLPISHTCFFTLDLPRYQSLDVMHKKIVFAINHCVAVDGDGTYNPGDISANVDA